MRFRKIEVSLERSTAGRLTFENEHGPVAGYHMPPGRYLITVQRLADPTAGVPGDETSLRLSMVRALDRWTRGEA